MIREDLGDPSVFDTLASRQTHFPSCLWGAWRSEVYYRNTHRYPHSTSERAVMGVVSFALNQEGNCNANAASFSMVRGRPSTG